jgi:hypothetical protein
MSEHHNTQHHSFSTTIADRVEHLPPGTLSTIGIWVPYFLKLEASSLQERQVVSASTA